MRQKLNITLAGTLTIQLLTQDKSIIQNKQPREIR